MDFSLSAEQELVRDTARAFVDSEITPHARDWDRSEEMDRGIVPKLADVGFLAGSGIRLVTSVVIAGLVPHVTWGASVSASSV